MKNRFDEAAKSWDQDQKRRAMAASITGAMRSRMDFLPHEVALDLGCGTGLITFAIAKAVQKIYAVDTSPGMLDMVRTKVQDEGGQVVPLQWDIASDDPFPEKVNAIVSAMAFHHIPDAVGAVQRMGQLLLPGGRVGIADLVTEAGDFHQDNLGVHHFGFAEKDLRSWFAYAGFRNINYEIVYTMQRSDGKGEWKNFPVFLLSALKK